MVYSSWRGAVLSWGGGCPSCAITRGYPCGCLSSFPSSTHCPNLMSCLASLVTPTPQDQDSQGQINSMQGAEAANHIYTITNLILDESL